MPQTSHHHAYSRQYVYKIKESSSADSPNSVISATASLKIRARFRFSHKSVKIKLLNAWVFCFFSLEALADACKSIQKRIANKQWTYCSSFMTKTWFYSLAPLFWFFCFLIRNLIHFFSSFYCCNWPKNAHRHAYSRHHAN